MQELEKILEGLAKHIFTAEVYNDDFNGKTITNLICLGDVRDVLEDHMNDGWISVDKRMPEAGEHVIVSFKCTGFQPVIAHLSEEGRWMMLQGAKGFNDVTNKVSAWRPLPEPYKPEGSENNQQANWRKQFMRRFERVE